MYVHKLNNYLLHVLLYISFIISIYYIIILSKTQIQIQFLLFKKLEIDFYRENA